jgi:hypothetical protein
MGPRQFLICRFCDLKVCEYGLFPREIVDHRCPWCESGPEWWVVVVKGCMDYDCYVQSCSSCGGKLCHCTIESMWGKCPWCGLYDRWVIIPSGG